MISIQKREPELFNAMIDFEYIEAFILALKATLMLATVGTAVILVFLVFAKIFQFLLRKFFPDLL